MPDTINLAYEIRLDGLMHCGSGHSRGLLNRAITRDAAGNAYIPGSAIKGKARHRAEQLSATLNLKSPHWSHRPDYRSCRGPALCDVCRLFGSPREGEKLFFGNATIHNDLLPFFNVPGLRGPRPAYQTWERAQVAIEPRTKTAARGHLFSSEFAVPTLVFCGTIDGAVDLGEAALRLLLASLLTIEHLGGDNTRGIGGCTIEIVSLVFNDQPIADPKALLTYPKEAR